MPINKKLINDILTKVGKAVHRGEEVHVDDPEEVGKYVFAVLALGAEFIPIFGSSVSALTTIFGQVLFSSDSTEKIWNKLRPRIEEMIDSKIEAATLRRLSDELFGLQTIFEDYQRDTVAMEKAIANQSNTEKDKDNARDTFKDSHQATMKVFLNKLASFRDKASAVAALPLFAIAANFYLLLLKDGIEHGMKWNYTTEDIDNMRGKLKAYTTFSPNGTGVTIQDIQKVEIFGGDLWFGATPDMKDAIKAMQHDLLDKTFDDNAYRNLDFVSYIKVVYARGRLEVKTAEPRNRDTGNKEAARLKPYSDYDSLMIINALSYAELWPHMLEKEIPESALERLDREVFFGPFGRYTQHVSWGEFSPPKVVPRNQDQARVKAVYIRSNDNINFVQVRYGETWGEAFGDKNAEGPTVDYSLSSDEYVREVTVETGHKLGKIKFKTSRDNSEYSAGKGVNSDPNFSTTIAPPGYELTSVYITNYEKHPPKGCEGIILGFRPVVMDMTLRV